MKRALWVLAVLVVLGGGFCAYVRMRPSRAPLAGSSLAEIQALVAEGDRLRGELQTLLADHAGLELAKAPDANILVRMPTSFARDLVSQLAAGLFSEVRLFLTGFEAHAEGEVTVPIGGTIGRYSVDVYVKEVRAVVRPGRPDLQFGGDRVRFRLPVSLTQGQGTAALDVRWQGRGLAGTLCGNLDLSTTISSDVAPATYTVAGELQLTASGDSVVARARVDAMKMKFVLQPTDKTWEALDAALAEIKRGRNPVCAAGLDRLNTRSIVKGMIDKGIEIDAPTQTRDDIALPARVFTSVTLRDRTVTLDARPRSVSITPDALWYGVALEAAAEAPPPKAPPR